MGTSCNQVPMYVKLEAQDPSKMANLYKPLSFQDLEQSLALHGLTSPKPKNVFPQTAGATRKPTKHWFQKPAHLLQKYFSLCLFTIAASLHLRALGGVQANHKQETFLLWNYFHSFLVLITPLLLLFIIHFFYCIFTEAIPYSPLFSCYLI